MRDTFRTIQTMSQGDYREKGSKFLCFAYPIQSEDEVKPIIQQLKKEHPQSRHACFGFRLGHNGEHTRANDDGEPGNSAGAPILGQLVSFDVTNVLAVVMRYFGGTKLGVPGLINAYKTSTRLALEAAQMEERVIRKAFTFTYPYEKTGEFMRILNAFDVVFGEQTFSNVCSQRIEIRVSQHEQLLEEIGLTYGITIDNE